MFLDQLVDELRLGRAPNPEIAKTATQHGRDLLRQGFSVSQVVHDYGDVCQAITEMAMERDMPVSTSDFRKLNQCLDDAIASAVTQYGLERDQSIVGEAAGESQDLAALAHELRNSIHTASVALEVIKSGSVGVAGSTGAMLQRSLLGANDLINRLLAEVYAARLGDLKES
jgi:signal transduction histidine kinase